MEQELISKLQKHSINVEDAVKRFGNNKELYLKYLFEYPQDKTYSTFINGFKLEKLWQSQNDLLTLIGISGNLGLEELYACSVDLLKKIRNSNVSEAIVSLDKLKETYSKTVKIINELAKEG